MSVQVGGDLENAGYGSGRAPICYLSFISIYEPHNVCLPNPLTGKIPGCIAWNSKKRTNHKDLLRLDSATADSTIFIRCLVGQ
ncbi:hypothetical protein DID88_008901 [Monilinia fructigena]|uniref:Uncharacterized protein n=1 Tax=Monilinia fructigena TaxID=38457 RepID=A0A395J7U4_9HELO|nr:hypothetical protein DID88_008901 [Monilinia fructigena]